MDYYKREQLPVLPLPEATDTVAREALQQVLQEHPANLVFFETDGKLSGIISQGDILRAISCGAGTVPVNRHFTSLTRDRYVMARDILRERDNIHEIPITDEDGRLLGMCTASDDLLYLEYRNPWKCNRYAEPFIKSLQEVVFVRPPRDDTRRRKITEEWISAFRRFGAVCAEADISQVPDLLQGDCQWILLPDTEMLEGARILAQMHCGRVVLDGRLTTYREMEHRMSGLGMENLIRTILDSGVTIYNLYATRAENTEGRRRIAEGFREWERQSEGSSGFSCVLPYQAKDFYGEYYTPEYAETVGKRFIQVVQSPVFSRLKDCDDPYFHVKNGERLTVGQPARAEKTIWFFGPCLMIGTFVEDAHTIESYLQDLLNQAGLPVKVVNCGCYESPYQEIVHMISAPIKPGDIIVMNLDNRTFPGTHSIDLMDFLDAHDVPCTWLLNNPLHFNFRVNKLLAEELFSRMQQNHELAANPSASSESLLDASCAMKPLYLDTCLYDFHPKEGAVIGEVSMHGNPFTRGHRYLIETSAAQVDLLFVILVEDEVSSYSFAERYAMAVDGTKDLKNVRVVPGGPFQGTRNVIAAYFTRSEQADIEESARAASKTYSEAIAGPLHITYCFLGEEPNNPQSRAFGQLKKKYIAPYGIKAVFIPRLEAGGLPVSATTARRAAAERDIATLRATLPDTTIRYILGEMDL